MECWPRDGKLRHLQTENSVRTAIRTGDLNYRNVSTSPLQFLLNRIIHPATLQPVLTPRSFIFLILEISSSRLTTLPPFIPHSQNKMKSRKNIQPDNEVAVSRGLYSTVISHSLVWIARFAHAYGLKSRLSSSSPDKVVPTDDPIAIAAIADSSIVRLAWTRPSIIPYILMTALSASLFSLIYRAYQASKRSRSAAGKQDITSEAGGFYEWAWEMIVWSHGWMIFGAVVQVAFGWAASPAGFGGWPAKLWFYGAIGMTVYRLYQLVVAGKQLLGNFSGGAGMADPSAASTAAEGNRKQRRGK